MSAVLKRYGGALIFITVLSLTSVLIIGFHFASRDVTWIGEVENYIKKENWEPDKEYIPLMDWAFFLHENGEEQYFYLYSQSEFIAYIKGLMNRVDKQIRSSIPKVSVDEILAEDRVMALVHRFPEGFGNFGLLGSSEVAYFILEDKFGKGLEGTIIMQDRRAGEYSHYSVWQITDWVLW